MGQWRAVNVACPTCSVEANRPCRGKRMTAAEPFHTARKAEADRRNRAASVNPFVRPTP